MATALVFGANGISGIAMLNTLFSTPHSEYKKIIALSRREPVLDHHDPRLVFKSVDLLGSVSAVEQALREAGAEETTDVFFYAYIEKADEAELIQVNEQLFQTALDAVQTVCTVLKTFSLQTGYKYYGAHLGGDNLAPYPWREDAPQHPGDNFYFHQEDLLRTTAELNAWGWIVTRPNFIIGQSRGNAMAAVTTIALYAVALRAQGKPLFFPGTSESYALPNDHSSAMNNAAFQLWTTRTDKTWNQVFNVHDGETVRWADIWPRVAEYFSMPLASPPADSAPSDTAHGRDIVSLHSVAEWAEHTDFDAVAQKAGIDRKNFDYATWAFIDFITSTTWNHAGSMDKARSLGWEGKFDTWDEGWRPALDQLREQGVIPRD